MDKVALVKAMESLKDALDDGDVETIEGAVADAVKLGLPQDVKDDVQEIRTLVDEYDFFTAADIAERVAQQLK